MGLTLTPLFAILALGLGHQGTLASRSHKGSTPPEDTKPVTCLEAKQTLAAVKAAMERSVFTKPTGTVSLPGSETPVTRIQVVDELNRLELEFQPYYTHKPRRQYCNLNAVRLPGDARTRAIRLIKLGFLEPVAPLVSGPAETITVAEFSDAVGVFVERWSDMTHLPSTKWSPYLQFQGLPRTPQPPTSGPKPQKSKA